MTAWTLIPGARRLRRGVAWFRLVDDLTGRPASGVVDARLERLDGGTWTPVDVTPRLVGGTLTFRGLERPRTGTVRYRLTLTASGHLPLYRADADGVEFDVAAAGGVTPVDVVLLPAIGYPLASHVRRLRGRVVDPLGTPIASVLVESSTTVGPATVRDRTVTDARGAFVLPLRPVADGGTARVQVTDRRAGVGRTVDLAVPADLVDHRDISIP